ncbi:Uma2 family endonuclease [Paraconexibacter algicola]|nr:Uma2 family endonuclease [Paraconexibacter algicola]
MRAAPRMTTAEFLALPETPDGSRLELLDGEVLAMNPPSRAHQRVALRVASALLVWTDAATGRGEVLPEIGVDPGSASILVPDIQRFAAGRDLPADARAWPVGDLVVEVRSESTARYDREVKRERYLEAGAREVWLVDPLTAAVVVTRPGEPDALLGPGETLTSPLLPGFSLPLARLRVD